MAYEEYERYRGAKVCVPLDGIENEALIDAVNILHTTKQAYLKNALRRCLVEDGFLP